MALDHIINNTMYQQILNKSLKFSDFEVLQEDDLIYDVPIGIIVLLSIFYGSISIMAVVGNSLVIWIVATTRQMQTVTNLFIANLALADVTIGIFAIPFQFHAALLQRWNLPDFMCPFCPFIQYLTVNVSVFTLTAIAVDRHRAILNPLKARPSKNSAKIVIILIWLISLALASPIAVALQVTLIEEMVDHGSYRSIHKVPFCQIVNFSDDQFKTYKYILVLLQYVIPVCVISFVYIQMALRLWGSKTPGNVQHARDVNLLKNKKKVIKMLVIVVALFVLCWLPLQTYNILHVTWSDINGYRYINIIWFCCDWLAMSNSCYNPFIYGIYNNKFKREFRKKFPLCFPNIEDNTERTTSMHTRASSIRSNYNGSSIRNKNLINPNNSEKNNKHQITETKLSYPSAPWVLNSNSTDIKTPTENSNWNKNDCKCLPNTKLVYRQVNNTSPPTSVYKQKVLYQPIDMELSRERNKCCCQNRDNSCNKNDWNFNNEFCGFYQSEVKQQMPTKLSNLNKATLNQKGLNSDEVVTDTEFYKFPLIDDDIKRDDLDDENLKTKFSDL